uniref:AI-2E family transporter n=1 Tax=Geobacter sp. (strain M21) TaxID=443144 RepID=C6E879_GEOSM
MDKKLYLSLIAAFFTVAAIAAIVLFAAPILKPLAWALIIGIATMPHYQRILNRFPDRPGRASGLMLLAVAVCLVLPASWLVITAAVNAPEWYRQLEQMIQEVTRTSSGALSQIPYYDRIMSLVERFGIDLGNIGGKIASSGSTVILNAATNMVRNLFDFIFTLLVALFLLFFIYRDGERAVALCIGKLAPNPRKAQHYATQIRSITTAVAVGTILTCCTQGVIAGLGYWVAGVPAPVFFAALTAIAALIPVVGTAIIWVPIVALTAVTGSYLTALLLALWCVFFVGFSDNAIRPLAIGAASDISVLAVVTGALCGVVMMGLLGLIIGPVIFAVLFSMWDDAVSAAGDTEYNDVP